MGSIILTRTVPDGLRSCGECGACCKTHSVKDGDFRKPAGIWCQFHKAGIGCTIHTERPNACALFKCLWLQGSGSKEHRPDKTGVVFDFTNNSDGLPGGMVRVWEAEERTLDREWVRRIAIEALFVKNIWVLYCYLFGEKILFVPPFLTLSPDVKKEIDEEAEKETIKIANFGQLFA